MSRIAVAFRALFAALGSAETAQRLEAVLSGKALPKIDAEAKSPPQAAALPELRPARSEAITLLAALQREARLVDLVKQPLADFSDEEIGAAARNVLGDCAAVLDRFFALQPLAKQEEGTVCEVPQGYDPARFKLSVGCRSRTISRQVGSSRLAGEHRETSGVDGFQGSSSRHRAGGSRSLMAQYILGIDLGTTNSVLAFAPLGADKPEVQLLPIPQLVAPGVVESRTTLPSFLYLAPEHESASGSFDLPWSRNNPIVVGELARKQSLRTRADRGGRQIVALP
jgi:hypothetical protein